MGQSFRKFHNVSIYSLFHFNPEANSVIYFINFDCKKTFFIFFGCYFVKITKFCRSSLFMGHHQIRSSTLKTTNEMKEKKIYEPNLKVKDEHK